MKCTSSFERQDFDSFFKIEFLKCNNYLSSSSFLAFSAASSFFCFSSLYCLLSSLFCSSAISPWSLVTWLLLSESILEVLAKWVCWEERFNLSQQRIDGEWWTLKEPFVRFSPFSTALVRPYFNTVKCCKIY